MENFVARKLKLAVEPISTQMPVARRSILNLKATIARKEFKNEGYYVILNIRDDVINESLKLFEQ